MVKTMKISEILYTYELLSNFVKKDIPMPGKLSWVISDNLYKLQEYVNKFNEKKEHIDRQFINNGMTVKNADGSESIAPNYSAEYTKQLQEIFDIDRQISFEDISQNEVRKIENLSVLDIQALDFMILK